MISARTHIEALQWAAWQAREAIAAAPKKVKDYKARKQLVERLKAHEQALEEMITEGRAP